MAASDADFTPSRVHDLDGVRARHGPLADTVVAHLLRGDPPADRAIDALAALPFHRGTALVEEMLAGHHAGPPALRELVDLCTTEPPWLDRDRVALGARSYRRLGLGAVTILASVSLLRGYHSAAVNKPLVFAERLQQAARIRLGETGRFVHDVARRGGMQRDGPGFADCVKVRLVHAQVRRRLLASDRWDTEAWGVPINQADLCATGISFSIAVLTAAREMGYRFTDAEADGLLHLWRYVTWLMGCPDALLWADEDEARALGEVTAALQPGADAWSRRLADALRGVLREVQDEAAAPLRPAFRLWRRYLDAMARELNGDPMADDLGIPHAPVRMLPLTRALVAPLERVRCAMPGGTHLAASAGSVVIDWSMLRLLQGHVPRFERPADVPGVRSREPVPEPAEPPPPFLGALFAYRRRGAP